MNEKLQNPKAWSACPSGEFRRLGTQLNGARRRQIAQLAGLALFALAGVALAVGAGKLLQREKPVTNLTCAEVRALASDYSAGRLSPEQAAKVTAHLAHCRRCTRAISAASGNSKANLSGGPGCNDECDRGSGSLTRN